VDLSYDRLLMNVNECFVRDHVGFHVKSGYSHKQICANTYSSQVTFDSQILLVEKYLIQSSVQFY
jgi:hypothetical protein